MKAENDLINEEFELNVNGRVPDLPKVEVTQVMPRISQEQQNSTFNSKPAPKHINTNNESEMPKSLRNNKLYDNVDPSTNIDVDIKSIMDLMGGNKDFSQRKKISLSRKQKKELKRNWRQLKRQLKGKEKIYKKEQKRRNKSQEIHTKNLSSQLKERDKAISDKSRRMRNKRRNASDVVSYLGYERMFEDGICEVEDGIFSQTIKFSDVSYQSAREDSQKDIFKTLCAIYDYFPPSVSIQFNIVNTQLRNDQIGKRVFYDEINQTNEEAREDAQIFNKILNDKMREGISNIKRERYLTFAVAATSVDEATPTLAKIRTDITAFFTKMGCIVDPLSGYERLKLMHGLLNPKQAFNFDYSRDISLTSGLTTKDAIAPEVLHFAPNKSFTYFTSDNMYCQVLSFRDFGSELDDRVISDIVDLPIPMTVSWHVEPWNKADAILEVKRKNGMVDNEVVNEQKNSANKGRDFTVLSQEIKYNKETFETILNDLQNNNQNLYSFTGLIYVYAESIEQLSNFVLQIVSSARVKSVDMKTLDYVQREGLNSILPLGLNHIERSRSLTTAQMAILVPFATQELDHEGGIYVGQNKNSRNLTLVDRKQLASPVGFVCGKTGSGKSFFVKEEMMGNILNNPNDQIIILDRAGEYTYLTQHIGGEVMQFGPDHKKYLNCFELTNVAGQSRIAQIDIKRAALLAQATASSAQAGMGLSDEEQSIISRAVEEAYANAEKKCPGSVPLLEDFYNILLNQNESLAQSIALRYERFVRGSTNFFNQPSNVSWDNRIIDINIKDLPEDMLVFCMIIVCESIRNQMYANFEKGKRTWIYLEEVASLFQYKSVLNYFSRFSNECRKFGGMLTGITQHSSDIFENKEAAAMVKNADYIMLLKQSQTDRVLWRELLGLSIHEESCIDESVSPGDGLLIAGASRIPITGAFPKNNKLYDIFSTDPTEVEDRKAKERLLKNKARFN